MKTQGIYAKLVHRSAASALALTFSLIMLFGAFGQRAEAIEQEHASSTPIKISTGPYLQNPSDRAMTVMWITDRNATGFVEFGKPNGELRTVVSSHDGLIDANERIHKVVLTDLEPGTVYRYRVVSRDILNFTAYKVNFGQTVTSDFQEFRTFDTRKSDTSFLVFNDLHENTSTFADMLALIGRKPYDFVALNGDSVSFMDREDQITSMLDAGVSNFASRIPMLWLRGNHDTRGAYARKLLSYIDTPNGHYYYSFDQGPVHFVVLDGGEDKPDNHPEYSTLSDFYRYRRVELEWLKAEVKSPSFRHAKYRVVIVHMPFARTESQSESGSPNASNRSGRVDISEDLGGMPDAYQVFGKTLEEAGVDLMISGHTHRAALIDPEPGRHNYPIIQGGASKGEKRTVIRVEVNALEMTVSILQADGSTFGTRKIAARR